MQDKQFRSDSFCRALQKNMANAKSKRKDEIDVLRTAFWFAEIRTRLNVFSAYEIERRLEPEAFRKRAKGGEVHRNKWPKYQVGQHVPRNALVTRIDITLPGSKRVLDHVLWKALRGEFETNDVDNLLMQLAPEIQQIVFRANSRTLYSTSSRISPARRQLKMLERRAGIDALACLTILLRESLDNKNQRAAHDIGISLYRVLLILCTTAPTGDFTQELFAIYRERYFSQVRHKELRFQFDDFDFPQAVSLLRELFLTLEDNRKVAPGWVNGVNAMCDLLDGDHGVNIKLALDPPIVERTQNSVSGI